MRVNYTQTTGFKQVREVPASITDPKEYGRGVLIGPPDLTELGLALEQTKRLNNWLVDQNLVEYVTLNRPGNYDKLLTGLKNVTGNPKKEFLKALMIRVLVIYQDYFNGG